MQRRNPSMYQPTNESFGEPLSAKLREVTTRYLLVHLLAALGWGLICLTFILAITVWLDLLFDLAPAFRAAAPWVALGSGLVLIGGLFAWRKRLFTPQTGARLIDTTANAQGVVLTGWDLLSTFGNNPSAESATSLGLAQLAIADASQQASGVSAANTVSLQSASRPWWGILGSMLLVGLFVLAAPQMARTEWNRFVQPWNDVPPASTTQLVVTPGDIDVRYGDPLEVFVEVHGDPVADEVELILTNSANEEEIIPTFEEADGRWRTMLTHLTQPGEYYARSFGTRSRRHKITILTVPEIEEVEAEVIPPPYAQGLGRYSGPLPSQGIAALTGTIVRLTARSQRPLSGGEIAWTDATGSTPIEMRPNETNGSQVQGEFVVQTAGTFELRVRDVEGQVSRDAVAATVTLKPDHRPFIRLLKPKPVSLATPSAYLPIEIAAEDDYGLAKIELYRSLNDSRALPVNLPLVGEAPRRQFDALTLPLSAYGLQPGDQIKLFARCEDNDPAGAKGAETPIAVVHIISQEEFEKMQRAREGLNVLLSKYRQAQRMMENLRAAAERLQDKTKAKKGLIPKEDREEAEKLAAQMRKDAQMLAKAAQSALPYDSDKELAEHLQDLAEQLKQAAEKLERQLKRLEGNQEQMESLDVELGELLSMLGKQSDLYNESTLSPLKRLEEVMPLLIAQSRFVKLVKAQRSLADRLASLKGRDDVDEPALKARMRDLQDEQNRLRKELDSLLADIEDAALRLPADEEDLAELKKSAEAFAKALRECGAAAEMDLAEQGLAEFSGARGHEHAENAAVALESLLNDSEGMGQQGKSSLVFRPSLPSLGQTAGQLLAEMGLGQGGGSGFSALRNDKPGLYGNLPTLAGQEGLGEAGREREGSGGAGQDGVPGIWGENPDLASWEDEQGPAEAGGGGMSLIPLRYRDRVGEYFRRLSTEFQKADDYQEEKR